MWSIVKRYDYRNTLCVQNTNFSFVKHYTSLLLPHPVEMKDNCMADCEMFPTGLYGTSHLVLNRYRPHLLFVIKQSGVYCVANRNWF
jgi:hypothetical protein